jgi:serine/threonine protein kinase
MKKSKVIHLTANDGSNVEFVNEIIGSGAMKDVYFSPDKSYVVCFYRETQDNNSIERINNIVGVYRDKIFTPEHKEYWERLLCWPTKIVEWKGKTGIVCPSYPSNFFFSSGRFQGKEKEGKWFASAKLRNKFLSKEEKGTWIKSFHMCINIARAVKRLHAAGLCHSDLSYKNVLVDPETGRALIIDLDGLVVPGKYPPDVVGTPDFIAPEVLETRSLDLKDPKRVLPTIKTDRHALAVLIYMYLLNRHPLRGKKIHSSDPNIDEELLMGRNALFIEHPKDSSNRPDVKSLDPSLLPQGDVYKRPYTICGPYLTELFDRAFIEGLHDPSKRPTADEWEHALIKTTDLLQPCENKGCDDKWFVFDNSTNPKCPFCGTLYKKKLPVLNLYSSPKPTVFKQENYRLMVYDKQSLYLWHVNKFISPNEKLKDVEKRPVGDFHFFNGKWILINRSLPSLYDADTNKKIEINEYIELTEGKKILFSKDNGGRLAVVQLVN